MDQQSKKELPQLLNEQEIIEYFKNRISEGSYYDVFELLDDFSIMIYPQIRKRHSKLNFEILSGLAKKIRKYVLFYSEKFEKDDLYSSFDDMWRYSFKLSYAKNVVRMFGEDVKFSPEGQFLSTNSKEIARSDEDNEMFPINVITNEQTTIGDLNELYMDSVRSVLREERILLLFNSLLLGGTWSDAYEFMGSVSYVINNQLEYCRRNNHQLSYKLLGAILVKIRIINTNYKKEIYGYLTANYFSSSFTNEKIDSFVKIWHKHYSIFTVRKMVEAFPSITDVNDNGELILKGQENKILDEVSSLQDNLEINDLPNELVSLYDEVDSFLIPEKNILDVFNSQEVRDYWRNIYDFLASLFYVIVIQLSFVRDNRKTLRYVMLRNLAIIASDIKKKYRGIVNFDDKEECINELKKILQALYGVKVVKRLARDFSITSSIDEQGNIIKDVLDETSLLDDDISEGDEKSMTDESSDVVVLRILKW